MSLWLLAVGSVFTVAAGAQERGEEVVGSITSVDGQNLTVQREGGPAVQVRVTARTEVVFGDSVDRKLFPNPTVNDLRAGMGVRFVYGSGTLDKITVHYVPTGTSAPKSRETQAPARPTELKVRVESVGRDRLEADVAGRRQTFRLEDRSLASRLEPGDLVILTVEGRGSEQVVTRIVSASLTGVITEIDSRGRDITIEVDRRAATYRLENPRLLDDVREGDRVRFEFEERGRNLVLTAIERRPGR
jgi:hypothetical protein